jgi:hypothetical protein
MKRPSTSTIVRSACACTLASLGLMSWSLLDPRPLPVIVAMSLGQVLGTLSFASYAYVVVRDLRPLRGSPARPAGSDDTEPQPPP